jgi:hypothetical protein
MTQPSANEQYLLELINAERAKTGAQPLAVDSALSTAAESHSQWMIATDTFSHTGVSGSSSTQRVTDAGYQLTGSWATGENIAWVSTRAPDGLQDEVKLLHANLMNSQSHRDAILNPGFREIGIGFETGEFRGWTGAFVTEDFARSGAGLQLTGVAFSDRDGDKFYDPGEGLGGITVKAVSASGASSATATLDAGGYQLNLPAGSYTVTYSGGGIATTTRQVTIEGSNVKVDLVNPSTTTSPPVEELPETSSDSVSLGRYYLVDADTDQILAELVEGSRIDSALLTDHSLTIMATANTGHSAAGSIESVRLTFDEGVATRVENVEPYALFGDQNGDVAGGLNLDTGQHKITFDLYGADGAQGNLLAADSVSFFVI